jgi:hypothetical protein
MKVSLPTIRLLLGMFALLLISACSDDGSSSSSKNKELNSINLYFSSNDISNEIRSFNPKTGESKLIANYNKGEHTALNLNTDNEKQGYESIIFSLDDTIYFMDTEKTKTKSKLASFTSAVCIFPNTIPDQSSFEGSTKGERILVDHTSVFITAKKDNECDTESAKIKKIDFSNLSNITIREVSSAQLLGETLFDYNYDPRKDRDNDDTDQGRYRFLGSNYNAQKESLQLNLYDDESNLIWETSFPAPNSLPTIHQFTQDEVLIQIGGTLYLQYIEDLFEANSFASVESSTESYLEFLFPVSEPPEPDLSTNISKLQLVSNNDTFALVDDGEVFFYDTRSPETKLRNFELKNDSVLDIKIRMTDNGTLIVHRVFTDSESLSRINTTSEAEESIITVGLDSKIDFQTLGNNIYINILSPTGRQAAWINKSFTLRNFENSLFAFTKDYRTANAETEIFLIASDEPSSSDGYLTKPNLYAFDPENKTTGRKKHKKNNDDKRTDFIFGSFLVDVKNVSESNNIPESEIFNDVYGKLKLNVVRDISGIDSNVTDTYFFNPSEQNSDEPDNANNALQLIDFEEDTI